MQLTKVPESIQFVVHLVNGAVLSSRMYYIHDYGPLNKHGCRPEEHEILIVANKLIKDKNNIQNGITIENNSGQYAIASNQIVFIQTFVNYY